jgi:hypothetical protein
MRGEQPLRKVTIHQLKELVVDKSEREAGEGFIGLFDKLSPENQEAISAFLHLASNALKPEQPLADPAQAD